MRTLILIVATALVAAVGIAAPDAQPSVVRQAADVSVTIDAEGSYGSGVVFKNKEASFVWTDAHVVSDTQVVNKVIDPVKGTPKFVTTYRDVHIQTEVVEDGRKVGEDRRLAKVIRYDEAQDIAVLLVYQKNYGKASARFATGIPAQGDAICHVGSFLGPKGANSFSRGNVAAVGRLRRDFDSNETGQPFVYDQISAVAHKGSSGGGVFDEKTGECLGLITEFLGISHNNFSDGSFMITPARRLREWAKNAKVEYALDTTKVVPSIKEIMAGPVTLTPIQVVEPKGPGHNTFPFPLPLPPN